jgi:outer membrane immunogenic protein
VAGAADMALKAPPAAPPVYNWTGFYGGIEGGAGWGRADDTDAGGFNSGGFSVTGGLVGGTLGYNWQINRIVLGLEGDGSSRRLKGSTVGTIPAIGNCSGAPPHCDSQLQALGTFRGRAGVTFGMFLPYVTGGLGVGALHGHEGDVLANGAVGNGTTTVGPSAAALRQPSVGTGLRRSKICTSTSAIAQSSTTSFRRPEMRSSLKMSGLPPRLSAAV